MLNDTLFLINPKANQGKALSQWKRAREKFSDLPENPLDVSTVDLTTIIKKEQPKLVVIAGGDGSVNAVASTISHLGKKPKIAIIPFGFGNALSYCLGVETIDKAVRVLMMQEKSITIDLMRTNIKGHERGVFNISLGFDARIVFDRQSFGYIGIGSYILSGVKNFFVHPENEITITIDHKTVVTAKASSLVIANCPILGQNLVISQKAKLNDGLLDCTIFSTKVAYLTNLRLKGFKHPLYSELGKVHFKASHIKVEGEPLIQIDGDPILKRDIIEIELLPKQVTFLRNNDKDIDQAYLPFVTQ